MLTEILRKRQTEERRNEIAVSARDAIRAFQVGELAPQPADSVIAELRASLEAQADE